ncbi:MAG TPA: hypothetical protein VEZ72_14825, partial [Paenibacillus sp.]|nr:hypothetical protein [Paenibacillus sp.]
DGMTWEETLRRAAAVANDRSAARFGLFHEGAPTPYSFLLELGARGEARFAEDGGARPALRSDAWRVAWETAADAYRSGAVYGAIRREGEPADPAAMFADGRLAMMLGGVSLADRIAGLGAEWGTVTEPVDPARPGVSQSFRYSAYLAVPNNGAQPDFAWEVVRFLAEGPLAEGGGGIPLDQAAFKRKYGEADVSAFARLRPAAAADAAADPNAGLSAEFFATLFVEGNRLADAVVGGGMPVDRAFDEWAGIGEALLLP